MKQCVYVIILTCILVLSVTGLSGCKRCKHIPTYTEDKFVDVYPWYMGFEGHETLTFLKNGKYTVHFEGQGLQVYNEGRLFSNGDCEAEVILLHHKVVFSNKKEGDLIFHYYKAGKEGDDTYEIIFQNAALIKPIDINWLSIRPLDSSIVVLGHEYEFVRRFSPNNKDSLYLNGSDDPRFRVARIKLNDIVYEVIP